MTSPATPLPDSLERQKPPKFFLILGIFLIIVSVLGVVMIGVAVLRGDTEAIFGGLFITLMCGSMGYVMFGMYKNNYYHEHRDHIRFRSFPRKEVILRYADIQAATVQTMNNKRWVYLTDPQGKKHGIDLRLYNTPRLYAYLIMNAAQNLPPEKFDKELAYLNSGFNAELTPQSLDQLWQVNYESFGNQNPAQPQQYGNQQPQQPFSNQQFGNNSGNAFGR